jgi:hypothetical protein
MERFDHDPFGTLGKLSTILQRSSKRRLNSFDRLLHPVYPVYPCKIHFLILATDAKGDCR